MKFYPRDWRGDQALRVVSLAARGLWIECLAIMHEAKPYGHLVMNGEPVDDAMLARLVGSSVEEVQALKAELIKAGVTNQGRGGVLVSRRMVRDQSRAKKGAKAVKKRWAQTTEKTAKTEQPNRSSTPEPTTQKPEARSQKPEKPPSPPPPSRHDPAKGLPQDVRAVMEAGGFISPPSDLGMLGAWRQIGADFEQDVLPTVRAVARDVRDRTGRAPFKLKLFDEAIRRKVAEDAAEIERLRATTRRLSAQPGASH
jgi:hypothetical protein